MHTPFFLLLIVQGLFFLLWAFLSFRAIFQIRAIAAGRTGQMFPGPISFVSAMTLWLKDPSSRGLRLLWVISLIGTMAPSVWIAMQAAPAQ